MTEAVLVVGFGGPERPGDVLPFLQQVTRGRNVPAARLDAVAQHYLARGGVSPINGQTRALAAAVEADLAAHGRGLPVFWGNRNWHPFLAETLAEARDRGVRRMAAFLTSAFSSYSGCRRYLEDIARARRQVGPAAPEVQVLRRYFDHPGFVEPFVDGTREALATLPRGSALVFVAHSVPVPMAAASGPQGGAYERQLRAVAEVVAERAAGGLADGWRLAFCSRSGPPTQAWLAPDVNDALKEVAGEGAAGVAVVPLGFTSDHMEVVHDLDTEAAGTARDLGLAWARVSTPGTDRRFVAVVRELLDELDGAPARALTALGPWHRECPAHCCSLG